MKSLCIIIPCLNEQDSIPFCLKKIKQALEKENIESRPIWKPMHLQPLYKGCDYITADEEDVSAKLFKNGLCLPSGSNLSYQDQARVIDIIESMIR